MFLGEGCQLLGSAGWAFPSRDSLEGAIFQFEKKQQKAEAGSASERPAPQPCPQLPAVCPTSRAGSWAVSLPAAWPWASSGRLQPWHTGCQSPGGNPTGLKLLPCPGARRAGRERGQEHGQGEQGWLGSVLSSWLQCRGALRRAPGSCCWLRLHLAEPCGGAGSRGLADGHVLRPWATPGMLAGQGVGVPRAGGAQPPSPPISTLSPAASITARGATCLAQTPAAFGDKGLSQQRSQSSSLHTSCLRRKGLRGAAEGLRRLGAG